MSKHDGDFYCLNYFHLLRTKNKLESHKKVCENKDFCNVVYAQYWKSDGCRNNLEKSSATKVSEHIPSGFSMSTVSSFKGIENKHDVCRGKDCIKKCCVYLKEHAVKIINCNPIHHGIFGLSSQGGTKCSPQTLQN